MQPEGQVGVVVVVRGELTERPPARNTNENRTARKRCREAPLYISPQLPQHNQTEPHRVPTYGVHSPALHTASERQRSASFITSQSNWLAAAERSTQVFPVAADQQSLRDLLSNCSARTAALYSVGSVPFTATAPLEPRCRTGERWRDNERFDWTAVFTTESFFSDSLVAFQSRFLED